MLGGILKIPSPAPAGRPLCQISNSKVTKYSKRFYGTAKLIVLPGFNMFIFVTGKI